MGEDNSQRERMLSRLFIVFAIGVAVGVLGTIGAAGTDMFRTTIVVSGLEGQTEFPIEELPFVTGQLLDQAKKIKEKSGHHAAGIYLQKMIMANEELMRKSPKHTKVIRTQIGRLESLSEEIAREKVEQELEHLNIPNGDGSNEGNDAPQSAP